MVVEREPPKATLHDSAQQPAFANLHQPEFGRPSPMQNRLQPNNVFNIPRPHHPRPEHHRPTPAANVPHPQQRNDNAPKFTNPVRPTQPLQSRPDHPHPDVVEIPKPANYPTWSSYSRPQPVYSSFNPSVNGFASVNAPQRPFIDLTTPKENNFNPDAAFLNDRFAATDPYTYIDAGKATENIKALLEGAFEDDEDKPRRQGRKKKVRADLKGLTEKLDDLDVNGVNQRDLKEEAELKQDEDEDEEADDGTIEGLKVKLLPHQVDGVDWMREKEIGVKKKNGILPKGGILADDMGLGKTIQSIALLLTNSRPPQTPATSVTGKKTLSSSVGKSTLVVAPLALIKQWEAEIKNRVSDSHTLRVYVHHGPQRTKRFEDLKKYDVVITTYQILVSEHGSCSMRENGPQAGCFGIHWYRVVLDEAHTIKNRNAKATKACYALRAEYRWCLTGTPMQNNLDELQSLIKFLRIKPYDDIHVWKDQITRPMSQGRGGVALKRVQFYLKAFMKRRTKEVLKKEGALNPGGKAASKHTQKNAFKITERRIESVMAEFSPEERTFYDRLEQRTDRSLERMMGGEKINYASALVLLLRLRQACNHPQLVGESMATDRDALTTGQPAGTQSPQKSSVVDKDVDEMADLLGGLKVQSKQCDICQKDFAETEVSAGSIRCTACENDLAEVKTVKSEAKVGRHKKHKKHTSSTEAREGRRSETHEPRIPKNRHLILDSSDEEEEDGSWLVPESQRVAPFLGIAGGTDDENAEGGGESLLSEDTNTEDESEIKRTRRRQPRVINLVTSDEEDPDDTSSSSSTRTEDEEDELSSSDSEASQSAIQNSAKIRHLLTILHRETPSHKVIVFSQFTSMLNLIEPFLKRDGFVFIRYDGSMRNDLREASLERLRNNAQTRILLCSLKCGSLGLNLTAASRVVILEPFWNPFVEEQAIDRVHRLNQTLDVVVYKLTIANTVEARILELQEKKRALASAAIEGKAVNKLSMKDILNLFKKDAEHGNIKDDVDGTIYGPNRKVLPDTGSASVRSGVHVPAPRPSQSLRMTPPVMEMSRASKAKEDAVYGRRW